MGKVLHENVRRERVARALRAHARYVARGRVVEFDGMVIYTNTFCGEISTPGVL